jgi:curved DNA-binding protein CbpA
MNDYFALLGLSRRPWLEPALLKERFLTLSGQLHPDRVRPARAEEGAAQRTYAELNAAYNCLREPNLRLRHLLQLELGAKPGEFQQIPPELMDLFMQVGQLCREADGFLKERDAATHALLRVQTFETGQEWTDKLKALRQTLSSEQETLIAEIKDIDAQWDLAGQPDSPYRSEVLRRLEQLCRLLSYFTRWSGQIQERIVRLSI